MTFWFGNLFRCFSFTPTSWFEHGLLVCVSEWGECVWVWIFYNMCVCVCVCVCVRERERELLFVWVLLLKMSLYVCCRCLDNKWRRFTTQDTGSNKFNNFITKIFCFSFPYKKCSLETTKQLQFTYVGKMKSKCSSFQLILSTGRYFNYLLSWIYC